MEFKEKYNCIIMKIITIIGIIVGVGLTPFHYYHYNFKDNNIGILFLIIVSILITTMMVKALLNTNDPKTKYNIFSFNKNWTNRIR